VSELDRLKEQIAYLKFWQGIMVVTEISLVGWLISTVGSSHPALWSFAAIGVVVLGFGIFALHRQMSAASNRSGGYSHGSSRRRHYACRCASFCRHCPRRCSSGEVTLSNSRSNGRATNSGASATDDHGPPFTSTLDPSVGTA
jgi:hypothetical protein